MKRLVTSLLAAAALAAAAPASAQAPDQGKALFHAGAQAYEAGQYAAAIQAFEQSYQIAARPGVLFSIAQAHRKQYYVAKRLDDLRAAVKAYRDYLGQVTQGGRRSDAAEALAELEALLSRLDAGGTAPAPPPPAAPVTRLMVSSQTAGALVSLDGGKPAEAPLIAEVKPGKHSVRVTSPGYLDETHELDVAAGAISPLDIRLKEKPGRLSIRAGEGAQVSLDGRFVASTPLSQALDVEPGRHLLTVTRNGYRIHAQEVEIGRDEAKSIDVGLETTTQRKVSYVLFGGGAAAAVVGGVLAGLAIHEQSQAVAFQALQSSGTAKCSSSADCAGYVQSGYTDHLNARDAFRLDAGIAFGAAVLVGATGVALFSLDQPTVGAVPARRDAAPAPASPPPRERSMEISAAPLVGPGLYGASLRARF